MTAKEFTIKCVPYNKQYNELFNEVPCPRDYIASQDEFYKALSAAIIEKKPLTEYLKKIDVSYDDETIIW